MNLYRHKLEQKLYTIEHLIQDIHHLNENAFAGIYAYPYRWKGEIISFKSTNDDKCFKFIDDTFEIVAHLHKI